MPITSWTSEGMNWDDPQPLEAKYWEALRLAVIERTLAIEKSFLPLQYPFWDEGTFYLGCKISVLTLFTNRVNLLIAEFVNHTDHSGDWDGLPEDEFAPNWTKSEILEETGDTQVYPMEDVGLQIETAKLWMKQQYKILNLLRVSKHRYFFSFSSVNHEEREGRSEVSWADCVSLWNAASYVPAFLGSMAYLTSAESSESGGSPNSRVCINRRRPFSFDTWGTGFNADLTFYGKMGIRSGSLSYYSEDGFLEDYYYNFKSLPDRPIDGNIITGGDISITTRNDKHVPTGIVYGCAVESGVVVLDWTITDGFKFKA